MAPVSVECCRMNIRTTHRESEYKSCSACTKFVTKVPLRPDLSIKMCFHCTLWCMAKEWERKKKTGKILIITRLFNIDPCRLLPVWIYRKKWFTYSMSANRHSLVIFSFVELNKFYILSNKWWNWWEHLLGGSISERRGSVMHAQDGH